MGRGSAMGSSTLLGVPVALGRGFVREEHRPGAGSFTVLDHGFWQRAFGGDRNVLGRTVSIGGAPYTIVGVLAPGARLPEAADMYAPLEYGETFSSTTATGRRSEFLDVIGRVRPGVSASQVEDDLRRLGTQLQAAFPQTNGRLTFTTSSLREMIIGDVADSAAHSPGRGNSRVAGCLCQCRQPATRPGVGTRRGAGGPGRAWARVADGCCASC